MRPVGQRSRAAGSAVEDSETGTSLLLQADRPRDLQQDREGGHEQQLGRRAGRDGSVQDGSRAGGAADRGGRRGQGQHPGLAGAREPQDPQVLALARRVVAPERLQDRQRERDAGQDKGRDRQGRRDRRQAPVQDRGAEKAERQGGRDHQAPAAQQVERESLPQHPAQVGGPPAPLTVTAGRGCHVLRAPRRAVRCEHPPTPLPRLCHNPGRTRPTRRQGPGEPLESRGSSRRRERAGPRSSRIVAQSPYTWGPGGSQAAGQEAES